MVIRETEPFPPFTDIQETSQNLAATIETYNLATGLPPLYPIEETHIFPPNLSPLTDDDITAANKLTINPDNPITIHEREARDTAAQLYKRSEEHYTRKLPRMAKPFSHRSLETSPFQEGLMTYFAASHAHSPGPLRFVSLTQIKKELLPVLKLNLAEFIARFFMHRIEQCWQWMIGSSEQCAGMICGRL